MTLFQIISGKCTWGEWLRGSHFWSIPRIVMFPILFLINMKYSGKRRWGKCTWGQYSQVSYDEGNGVLPTRLKSRGTYKTLFAKSLNFLLRSTLTIDLSFQMSVIERNIRLFMNMTQRDQLVISRIRRKIADHYVRTFRIKSLPENSQLLGKQTVSKCDWFS